MNTTLSSHATALRHPLSPPAEKLMLLVLAAVQFCHIVDFMVMMPLGPQLMRLLSLSAAQFGLLVSAYTLSAGLAALLGLFFVDRVNRKTFLLGLFAGLLAATVLCGLAHSFTSLLIGRLLAGAFGGLMTATVMAYLSDCIPEERRGAATGTVMAAFSAAAVAGVPLGLCLASYFSWRAPFLLIAGLGSLLLVVGWRHLPSLPAQSYGPLALQQTLRDVLFNRRHLTAFLLIASLMFAGFSVIPFLSPYMVHNAGLTEEQLPWIYFCGGLATLFTAPRIGKLADKYGKGRVFRALAYASLLPLLVLTQLSEVHLVIALIVSTVFMVLISGRLIPAMALITTVSAPALRGRFLSMNSALQQLAASGAAFWPTFVLTQDSDGRFLHYGWVGAGAMLMTAVAIYLSQKLEQSPLNMER